MSRCILENEIRQKMDIIKFVKCYDYYNNKIIDAVRKMDEIENMRFPNNVKSRIMAIVNNGYTDAILSMSEFLDLFQNKININTKSNTQVKKFLNKYYDLLVPKNEVINIYTDLNNKCDRILVEKINRLEHDKISSAGLTKRYLATICSTVEEVYGAELNNPTSKFDIKLPETKTSGCTVAKFMAEKKTSNKKTHSNDGK